MLRGCLWACKIRCPVANPRRSDASASRRPPSPARWLPRPTRARGRSHEAEKGGAEEAASATFRASLSSPSCRTCSLPACCIDNLFYTINSYLDWADAERSNIYAFCFSRDSALRYPSECLH